MNGIASSTTSPSAKTPTASSQPLLVTNKTMEETLNYSISQRKPDTSEGESSYSSAIKDPSGFPVAVGYGFTQEKADEIFDLLQPHAEVEK